MNRNRGTATTFTAKHVVGLFVFYVILAFCILTFTFFYVFNMGEMRLVTALTLAFAIVATVIHVKTGKRDRLDTLIDKGP